MIQFLIRGIDPSIILVDKKVKEIFTQRELASNIFRSFKAMYQQVCVEKPLTHLIKDIDEYDSHSITNFMSVRRKNFDEAEEPIFTIVTAEHTEEGVKLMETMTELFTKRQIPIYIGGDKIKIDLIPPPQKSKQSHRTEFFKDITDANTRLKPDRTKSNKPIILSQIRAPPTITKHPSLITLLANHRDIIGCEGVFINLRLGPLDPTITLLLKSSRESCFLKKETVEYIINTQLGHIFEEDDQPSISTTNQFRATPSTTTTTKRGGRGRGRTIVHTPSHLFNKTSITAIIKTISNVKWHAIFNGRGGSSTSNIYRCDFDSSGLRLLVDKVAYEKHKSYDTYDEAFADFILYFPDVESQEDIDRMNANAPLEASNLNNPSPSIRRTVGNYRLAQIHSKEEFWTYNTYDPTIGNLRKASTERMNKKGANPPDSFDFLDDKHSRIPFQYAVAPITLQSIQLYITDNNTKTSQPATNTPSYRSSPARRLGSDNTSTINITHIQTPEQRLEDDTLSQLSNVSISKTPTNTSVSGSALQSSPKRARHFTSSGNTSRHAPTHQQPDKVHSPQHTTQHITPTFVNFITDIKTHANDIRTSLLDAHKKATTISPDDNTTRPILPFPFNAISDKIHFAMIPGSTTTKLGLVRMNIDDHTDSVAQLVQSLPTTINNVFVSSTPPATGYDINHIDVSPPQNGSPYPLNCRIIGCQMHNIGREPNPATTPTNILETLAQHTYIYHQDLIHDNTIATSTLEQIGWYRCPGCQVCHFTKESAEQHRNTCKTYQQRIEYKNLIQLCPPHKQDDLFKLIDSNIDAVTIKSTVLDWMMEPLQNKDTNTSP